MTLPENSSERSSPSGGLARHLCLFGTTMAGFGSFHGTVFELAAGSSTITTLAAFNGTNGAAPLGSLVMDTSGNLFGSTTAGGTHDQGTVFEVVADSGTNSVGASLPAISTRPISSSSSSSDGSSFHGITARRDRLLPDATCVPLALVLTGVVLGQVIRRVRRLADAYAQRGEEPWGGQR